MKIYTSTGNRSSAPCFPACCSNLLAIRIVNDMLLKFYATFFTLHMAMHIGNWFWLHVYWSWLPGKICIYFTNIYVISSKLYCLQNFLWTNQTIINFILAFLHVLINIDSSVKIPQKILQPVVNCPDSQVVRATRWKARGRWFDSRRRHIISFWTLRFPFLTAWRKPYINEIKHDIHPELWLHRDWFKTRKIWRRFILQHISFHKKMANHFWTDGQWQKIGKTLIYQIFFYKKMSHSYSGKQDWYFDIFMYILWHPSFLISASGVIVNTFKHTLGTQN